MLSCFALIEQGNCSAQALITFLPLGGATCGCLQVASIFVPVVVLLALLTWICWFTAGRLGCVPDEWVPEGADKEVCPRLCPYTSPERAL